MKVLLVDDDAFLRDMYAMKFTESGDTVFTARNGTEALRVLQQEGPVDVVLLDMVMPGLSGADLIKEVLANEKGKEATCVVLSNQGEKEGIEEAKAAGAKGYIIKAESIPSEVVTRVRSLMEELK